jgi:hypothetical protein
MKTIKAIKIDAFKQVIELVNVENTTEGIEKALEADNVFHMDEIHLPEPFPGVTNDFYANTESEEFGFYMRGKYIYGHGLIIGHHKVTENDIDTSLTVEAVERLVRFV